MLEMIQQGAQVIQIDGSFDDALTMVVEITDKHPICLVNSINPYRIEGQKTSAFEICDVLGSAPDWLCLPVGNAGNITSYWAGFKQYNEIKSTGLPQVLGVQAAGSAPLVVGHPIENPETVATAIRIGKPARGEQALQAAEESQGRIIAAIGCIHHVVQVARVIPETPVKTLMRTGSHIGEVLGIGTLAEPGRLNLTTVFSPLRTVSFQLPPKVKNQY